MCGDSLCPAVGYRSFSVLYESHSLCFFSAKDIVRVVEENDRENSNKADAAAAETVFQAEGKEEQAEPKHKVFREAAFRLQTLTCLLQVLNKIEMTFVSPTKIEPEVVCMSIDGRITEPSKEEGSSVEAVATVS